MNKVKYSNEYRQLSLNIAFYRKLKGLTQEELSEIVGISRSHLGHIESLKMKKMPSLNLLFAIAKALDVTADKLLEIR